MTQGFHCDRLEIIVSLQSGCLFRLFARGCHHRHTALTLDGEVNVRVSRGANNCHVPRQKPAAFKWNQCETIRFLAVLTYQANWLFGNWDPSSYESSSNDASACDVWTIYQGPVCLQGCADRERRPASHIGKGAGHTRPA